MLATVCGVEWNVNAAAFPPLNVAIVRTDSVKNAREVSSPDRGDIGFNINTKLMLAHSASPFIQRISKKQTRLQFQHPNYVCFDAYKAKYVHTAIQDF